MKGTSQGVAGQKSLVAVPNRAQAIRHHHSDVLGGGCSPQTPPRHTPWQGDVAMGWHRWAPVPCPLHSAHMGGTATPTGGLLEGLGTLSTTFFVAPRYSPLCNSRDNPPGTAEPPAQAAPAPVQDTAQWSPAPPRTCRGRWPCSPGPDPPSCRSQDSRAAAGHGGLPDRSAC